MGKRYPKVCLLCGIKFIGTSGRAKYCPECRAKVGYESTKSFQEAMAYKRAQKLFKKYKEGVIYTCKICGRKIRVYERTRRSMCNECLMKTAYGRSLISQRKDIREEIVEDN